MQMPVVIVTHEFFPKRGGIAVYVEETARAANTLGWPVTVWAPRHPGLRSQSFPFQVETLPIEGTLSWPDRRHCMQMLRHEREQLDQATLVLPEPGPILAAMYLEAMGRLHAKRLVLILHGSEILRCARLPHRRHLFGALLQRADRIGVVSRYTRKLLLRYYPGLEAKIYLVPGGLRSDFKVVPEKQNKKATQKVLSVGRLHRRKGQHNLLEAATLLPDSLKAQWVIQLAGPCGQESYREALETLSREHGLQVDFLGEVADEDLPELYAQADLFALTSKRSGPSVEGFGLVAIEAGAAGLPVVAHRSGGIPEAVINGKTGLIVGPENRHALTKALEALMQDPELRKRLGDAGKRRAAELSWERNVEQLLSND